MGIIEIKSLVILVVLFPVCILLDPLFDCILTEIDIFF